MKQHLVTVCIVCILCAAHAPCSAHQHDMSPSPLEMGSKGTVHLHNESERREALFEGEWDSKVFVKKMFSKYGDGEHLTMAGFEELIKALQLDPKLFHPSNVDVPLNNSSKSEAASRCVPIENLVKTTHKSNNSDNITFNTGDYEHLCPLLLYKLVEPSKCILESEISSGLSSTWSRQVASAIPAGPGNTLDVWLWATLSIIVISLCGLLGVAVIPVMQKTYYQQLLQFLVALAVGTLCGDALLHLLPHAMMATGEEASHGSSLSHTHDHDHGDDPHSANMWKGLVTSLGVVFFFLMEKCLTLCAEWRKRRQRKSRTPTPRVRVMRDTEDVDNNTVGEKLCKHKYSSYPYCYGDITKEETLQDGNLHKNGGPSSLQLNNTQEDLTSTPALTNDRDAVVTAGHDLESEIKELKPSDKDYTIIIREHKNHHHGHSHTHGHVHSAPNSLSSVAWMVIMGDGLHNFTDGMAIGAAFAANIAGGFSTAVAVFCHELPHELGDFAVLLKAGMSAKQAVFYNLLSSVLCFFGMCLGIVLGNTETASQWIFAVAAGMFLYIALVDMIPELSTSHTSEGGSVCQCLLQLMGLMSGIGIMLLIAHYEHDLKRSFT